MSGADVTERGAPACTVGKVLFEHAQRSPGDTSGLVFLECVSYRGGLLAFQSLRCMKNS